MSEWQPTHRHYKGNLYRVIGEGVHTETGEKLTLYDGIDRRLWARPSAMFNEFGRFLPLDPKHQVIAQSINPIDLD